MTQGAVRLLDVTNTAFLPFARLTPARRQAAETGTLVTGSDRLRREYIYAYDYARMVDGDKAWQEPSISGFDTLLRRDHDRARAMDAQTPVLLSPVEQHALFRRLAPDNLQHLTSLFEEAWGLVHAWHLDYNSDAFQASENTRSFKDWANRAAIQLTENNAITPAQLADQQYATGATGSLYLTGFDVLTTQRLGWLKRARERGADVHIEAPPEALTHTNPGQDKSHQSAACFSSVTHELTAAIGWARERLESASKQAPPPRIGIVVPDLLAQHATVARLLHTQLEGSGERTEALYNMGGGLPLAQHPLVESALQLLGCIHKPTHFTTIEQLLADPALPAINTHNRLPQWCDEFLTLPQIPQDVATEQLRGITRQIADWTTQRAPLQSVQHWWSEAASVLRVARWHTARKDSEGYQATNALLELLIAQAPHLDNDSEMSWSEAFALLESVASQTLFAPASTPAPIQVLGYLEANDLDFDHLWISGMDSAAWPSPVTNNPLLPASELARVSMPRTTYASELEFAQRWLARATLNPQECRVSFVIEELTDEEQSTQEPQSSKTLEGISPLFADWQHRDQSSKTVSAHPLLDYWNTQDVSLTPRNDAHGPPLTPGRLNRATRRLENQAACPMRGWSLYTLDLELPIPPHSLPNALERGVLLHNALQLLFEKLSSSTELQALSDEARAKLCLELSVQQTEKELHRFTPAIQSLESARLSRALQNFLQLETRRKEFSVATTEQAIQGQLGPWEIHLKIDRVDDLPDGQLVIDYKSTAPSSKKLLDDRLTAPQIPLYVLFLLANGKPISELTFADPLVQAGAFAELKPDSAKYVGLRAEHAEQGLPTSLASNTPWPEVLDLWCTRLMTLSEELEKGWALASPTKDACNNCHLHRLCRYHLNHD